MAVSLPSPQRKGRISVEECLERRRSVRTYKNAPLSAAEIGQLVWAAQGITSPEKQRTAPSAGALYPLEVYVVVGVGDGLAPGVYRYEPFRHQLLPLSSGDVRKQMAAAALDQDCVRDASVIIVFTAVYRRTMRKYGDRGVRYVDMEAGHAAQNVLLQAVALGLVSVPVAAFDPSAVSRILKPGSGEEPIYLVCLGRPR